MQARGLILVAVCLLTLTAGTSVVSGADLQKDQSNADLEKQLQQLLHERVTTAERAVVAVQAAFEAETVTLFPMLDAVNKLAEASLAVATTTAQEIEALEKNLERMQSIEQMTKVLYETGTRGGEAMEYAAAKRERQSAEIALIKARLKAKR